MATTRCRATASGRGRTGPRFALRAGVRIVEKLRPWAIVEIADGVDPAERAELIRAAYRSSRSGLVALALRGVSARSVDSVLDGTVDARDREVCGVVYLDGEDRQAVMAAAARASVVVAVTERFRHELNDCGIAALDASEAATILRA